MSVIKKPAKKYLKTGIFDFIEGLKIHFKGLGGKATYKETFFIAW